MCTFQRRRGVSLITLSPASVSGLKYRPNSFILVNRSLTLSAIVVTIGAFRVFPPSSTAIVSDAAVDPAVCLVTENRLEIDVIFQVSSCCFSGLRPPNETEK